MNDNLKKLLKAYAKGHGWAKDSTRRESTHVALRRLSKEHPNTPDHVLVALAAIAGHVEVNQRSQRNGGAQPRQTVEKDAFKEATTWLTAFAQMRYPSLLTSTLSAAKNTGLLTYLLIQHNYFRKDEG